MKPFDSHGDLAGNSVPDLIKHLWDLYMHMSLDPVLLHSAEHVRQAVLSLEATRRMAHQVALEAQSGHQKGRRRKKSLDQTTADLEWQGAQPVSQTKH